MQAAFTVLTSEETAEAVRFLRALRGIELVGCDVVEVSPSYEGPRQQTALAAANVLFELFALRVLLRGGRSCRL